MSSLQEIETELDKKQDKSKVKVDGTPIKKTQGFVVDSMASSPTPQTPVPVATPPPASKQPSPKSSPGTSASPKAAGQPRSPQMGAGQKQKQNQNQPKGGKEKGPKSPQATGGAGGKSPAIEAMKEEEPASSSSPKPEPKGKEGSDDSTTKKEANEEGGEPGKGGELSKAQLKAQRREIQEKQRAEKVQKLAAEGKLPPPKKNPPAEAASGSAAAPSAGAPKRPTTKLPGPAPTPASIQFDDAKVRSRVEKTQLMHRTESQKQVPLFSHLRQYEQEKSFTAELKYPIHPAIIQFGLRMQTEHENSISGSNARCIGMLLAFKQVVTDYQTPPDQTMSRHFDSHLKPHISYLQNFRPLAISMGNAIRYLKKQIAGLNPEASDQENKGVLLDAIDRFIRERIVFADEVIVTSGVSKIKDGDVIMTYACSSIIEKILKAAHAQGKKFRVIVVDSRPKLEGRTLVRRLVQSGLSCTYILLNAVSFVMKEVSKVFLGAHTLFSNGTVMSRVGTAVVAMMASNHKVPVIVCCETYKFSDRVQLDSFVSNELGNPDDLVSIAKGETTKNILSDWRDISTLKLLNLYYDLTPRDYVSVVITEVGMIPCTSVPVILREYLPQ